MAWHDEAEQGLPPQRHQEPASLRQDILDELTDHLALAAERESESGIEDEQKIRTRVLKQFGNPAAVARALWWDAMKETVVKDWIQISINAIICISVVVFMGLFYRQMQSTNTTLINALNERPSAADELYPSVEFVLHRGSIDGSLAEGLQVVLQGRAFNEEPNSLREESDSRGYVQFGPIRAGQYTIQIIDEETGLQNSRSITLYSGDEIKTVHIPVPPTMPMALDMKDPPVQHIADTDIRLVMTMVSEWIYEDDTWNGEKRTVIVMEDGIFPTRDHLVNDMNLQSNELSQSEKRISQTYGNRLHFLRIGLAKSYLVQESGDERFKWLQDGRYGLLYQGASFSHDLQSDGINSFVFDIPKEALRAYEYYVRLSANSNHIRLGGSNVLPEVISKEFTEFVIDEVRLVERSLAYKWVDDTYSLHSDYSSDTIMNQTGSVFSLANAPKDLPSGYKLLLAFQDFGTDLHNLEANLHAYLDASPGAWDSKVPIEEFSTEQIRGPIWEIDANSISSAWRHQIFGFPRYENRDPNTGFTRRSGTQMSWKDISIIDLTATVNGDRNFANASGILFKWDRPSRNALEFVPPQKLPVHAQPVWLIMKPIVETAGTGANVN